jgi:hypothetical protein
VPAAACQIVGTPSARYSARVMLIVAEPPGEVGMRGLMIFRPVFLLVHMLLAVTLLGALRPYHLN